MRLLAWAIVLSLTGCGKTGSDPGRPEPSEPGGSGTGARGGESSTSGAAAAGAGAGAGAGSVGGRATGGVGGASLAGAAGSAPASNAGRGGMASGGSLGEAGAGGSGDDDVYDACGCACCGVPVNNRCFYPELGEELSRLKAEDAAAAASPDCAAKGCGSGTHYARCMAGDVEDAVTYVASGYADVEQYLIVSRESTQLGRCSRATFRLTSNLSIELPEPGPAPMRISDGFCGDESSELSMLGSLGYIRHSDDTGCVLDFDFTLFFLAEDGTADPVRFKAAGVAMCR